MCNAGDAAPCVGEPGITVIPSCGQLAPSTTCAAAGVDPGVFQLSATGIGEAVAGSSCAGMVFDITQIDPVSGMVRFTPRGGTHIVLPGTGSFCRIGFTFDVLKLPTIDQSAEPGVQTVQLVDHTQYSGSTTASGQGSSSGATTVNARRRRLLRRRRPRRHPPRTSRRSRSSASGGPVASA